ncbi:hypothetical protein ACN38_g9392 [Penicillium nordicum]|uniref:Sodium/calcium exchanger membrane region domain-containing protein n=1 Tax=Penicillium nordicum TaxID=229535 RepID=A0A0M8P264_9EURO|nr:hypothetical protein ACN38_g9392 [Penicillium nordicum]
MVQINSSITPCISPTLIALLTTRAEYEELAVVVVAILQGHTPLALGNVMGSSISNILPFRWGFLCHPGGSPFDSSAKIYSALQFFITTLFVILTFAAYVVFLVMEFDIYRH